MIVKKFQAPTEREAIIKAQEELGSTAVVLNVKTIKQRGFAKLFKKDAVEVTAALEEKDFVDGINKSRPSFDNTMNKEQMINRSMVSTGSLPSINLVCSNIIISGKTIFLLILNEFYGRIIVPDIIGGSVSRTIINKNNLE